MKKPVDRYSTEEKKKFRREKISYNAAINRDRRGSAPRLADETDVRTKTRVNLIEKKKTK